DPALIQPLADDPQQLTRDDFAQPVGDIVPAPYTAIPFIFPVGSPIFLPIFLDEPAVSQSGGWNAGLGNWGGDSGGGGSDWGGGEEGGGGGVWGGGGDWGGGGGDFGGGGGDSGGGGGDF